MAKVLWRPNALFQAQAATLTVTAVANGGTLTATINAKNIVYTCTATDTTTTAAAAWEALIAASTAPAEFGELTWSVSGTVITGVMSTPGTPFILTKSQAGGATCTLATTVANISPSDVNDPNNWLRAGTPAIPQNGDDVDASNSSIPMLWNLDLLAAVQFASFRRSQSMTGQIGLPDQNPAGYPEYRPTSLQFSGVGTVAMYLGGGTGSGPSLERYNVGALRVNLFVSGGGTVTFLGTNANNTLKLTAATVIVAPLATDTSTVASAVVDGGGSASFGPGCTFSGTLTVSQGSVTLGCSPASVVASNGSQVTVNATTLTFVSVSASGGSVVTWLSDSTITTLVLQGASVLDHSSDIRSMVITNSTIDQDCQVLDPLSAITWTNATTVVGYVSTGPFQFLSRTVKIV